MGLNEDITLIEAKLRKLKIEYDQYFGGISKIPPFKLENEVKALIRKYSAVKILNTSLAFKFNSLVSRYTSYSNLWTRTVRRINDGTIKKGAGRNWRAQKSAAKNKTDENPAERLYKDLVKAKDTLNQDTSRINMKSISAMMTKQTSQIIEKYKCKEVQYKVIVEGGTAKIKAIPIK